jgi:hypothetical protein
VVRAKVPADGSIRLYSSGLGSGIAVVRPGTVDVALGGSHRLVPKKLHQAVHADVCIGQFGREGVPESVHQNPSGALSVEPSLLLKGTEHPVLQRAEGDTVAIWTDEQRGSGRPGSQPGFPLVLSIAGKAGGS